jgi:tetratricopeptide (TPR) repeat protein
MVMTTAMMIAKRTQVSTLLLLARAWLLCVVPGVLSAAELPKFDELLGEAQALYRMVTADRDGEESPYELMMISRAQAYAGDTAGALATGRSIQDSTWKSIFYITHFEIQAQRGRFTDTLPDEKEFAAGGDNANFLYAHTRFQILQAYSREHADRGNIPAAVAVFDRIPMNRPFYWHLPDLYRYVAEAQLRDGDPDGARSSLKEALALVEKFPKPSDRNEQLTKLAEACLTAGDRNTADQFLKRAVDQAAELYRDEAPSPFEVRAWMRIGRMQMLIGHTDAAEESLSRAEEAARSIGHESSDIPGRPESLNIGDCVRALAEIGGLRSQLGQPEPAERAFGQALQLAAQTEDEQRRATHVANVITIQLESDELTRAAAVVKSTPLPAYWRATLHLAISEAALQADDRETAKSHLSEAHRIVAMMDTTYDRHSLWIAVAERQAGFGDVEAARLSFQRAIELANADEESRIGHYQSIARGQIRAGLYAEAYQTQAAIGESRWRLLPLTELVLAVAKEQAASLRRTE